MPVDEATFTKKQYNPDQGAEKWAVGSGLVLDIVSLPLDDRSTSAMEWDYSSEAFNVDKTNSTIHLQ